MTKLRWNCDERGECYLRERWDCESVGQAWREEHGAWPFPYNASGECSPTDLDCVIAGGLRQRLPAALERNGNVIVIENKRVGEELNRGQEILLEALCLKGVTVMLQTCSDNARDEVVRFEVWYCDGNEIKYRRRGYEDGEPPVTRLERDQELRNWWTQASRPSMSNQLGVAA